MTNIKQKDVTSLSLAETFNPTDSYCIPMYQRNYAWGDGEIDLLITDMIDSFERDKNKNYYIGTLVVHKATERSQTDQVVYEVIDGQQRLTTLTLLMIYLKQTETIELGNFDRINLTFANRKNSNNTLQHLFEHGNKQHAESLDSGILHGYKCIDGNKKLKEYIESKQEEFLNFISNKIILIRVCVPEDTDLNHYFEIMNTRGEQLEKHEIIKAELMGKLKNEDDRHCFHKIWEACSNMERYVQLGFNTKERKEIFGEDWNRLPENFAETKGKINPQNSGSDTKENSIYELINPQESSNKTTNNEAKDESIRFSTVVNFEPEDKSTRFSTVVNFENFLLHVLNVFLINKKLKVEPLDDKKLIESFSSLTAEEEIKNFADTLLKCRFLYDKFVIKHETTQEGEKWSLKKITDYGKNKGFSYTNTFAQDDGDKKTNKSILMLLSALHVSYPSQAYKHWLNAVLLWLYQQSEVKEIDGSSYIDYLESLARNLVFGRYLSENSLEYDQIVKSEQPQEAISVIKEEKLSYGSIKHNFVFNFLDYLLWKESSNYKSSNSNFEKILPTGINTEKIIKKIQDFEFTFRSSVEHYYPQNPTNPTNENTWKNEDLDNFGNLCLISHSQNSKLSNHLPEAKKEHYNNKKLDSIKQAIMMEYADWTTKEVYEHHEKMLAVLQAAKPKTSR